MRARGSVSRNRLLLAGLAVGAVGFVVVLNLTPIYSKDFWLQVKVGELIRESGAVPRTLLFACTEARDYPFVAYEWLPSAAHSVLLDAIGLSGLVLYKCALALVALALAVLLAWQVSGNRPVAVLIGGLVLLALNGRMDLRPEIYAFLMALINLNLLQAFLRTGRLRWLVALLPVSVVWANTHGTFLFNLGLPLIFAAGGVLDDRWSAAAINPKQRAERLRRIHLPLIGASAAMFLVTLINPYGFELIRHLTVASQAEFMRQNIVEWRPTFSADVREELYVKVYLVFAAVVVLSFAIARRRTSATCILLLVSFGYLSIDAVRCTAWFAIVGTYILAVNLGDVAREAPWRARLSVAGTALLGAGILIVGLRGNVRGMTFGSSSHAPLSAAAIEFIERANISGNVFNSYRYGDQLVYRFYPRIRVVIDSRVDAYGAAYYSRYRTMNGESLKRLGPPEDFVAFLDRYDIETIVTHPFELRNWQLKRYLPALAAAGFQPTYSDHETIVLQRAGIKEAARSTSAQY